MSLKQKRLFTPLVLLLTACATAGGAPAVEGLVGLDEAIAQAVQTVEARVEDGAEIAVYKVVAENDELGEYLAEDLNGAFSASGKLQPLAREQMLNVVNAEQEFQMSDLVSDKSAVGLGHNLGTKVVVSGTFSRYANFSQLWLRAVDVRTAAVLATYKGRIGNKDPVLANLTAQLGDAALPAVIETALALLDSGKDLYAAGKYDEAIRAFNAALAMDKNLDEAYFYRGIAYYNKGDKDGAIADFTEVLRINSNDANTFYNRGVVYDFKGDKDRAIADYTESLRINPNFASAYYNRGVAYSEKNDYDRAIADYNETLKIDPNFASAYINLGVEYEKKGDRDRAIAYYGEALRINPNDAETYSGRGAVYGRKGDYDRAIADFTEALRINPNYAVAFYNRGRAYGDKGDFDTAIADLTSALRINSNDAKVYYFRGLAYNIKGDLNRAIADFEAVLRINPNDADARASLDRTRRQRGR